MPIDYKVFPIIRRARIPDPYAGERCVNIPGICMRLSCGKKLVLCQTHAEEVFRGEAKGPPLRQNPDYVGRPRTSYELK